MADEERSKTFVSMRLDAALVAQLDALAEAEGLSRTAVLERLAWRWVKSVRVAAPRAEIARCVQAVFASAKGGDPDEMIEVTISGVTTFREGKGKRS